MVLAVVNHKGGVGKTTFSLNLAATAADNGYTTCLIDLDPKGDLTKVLLDLRISDLTVFDLMCYSVPLRECLKATSMENLYIVPASNRANKIVNSDDSYVLFSLRGKINQYWKCDDGKLGQDYFIFTKYDRKLDLIIIDTPPILDLLTAVSLVTATHVIIPIYPTYFCLQGTNDLIAFLNMIKEKYNPGFNILGYVINNIDFLSETDKEVERILRVTKPNVFNNVIQRNPIIESALVSGQSLVTYSKDNPAALDGAIEYEKVFEELGRRAEKDIPYYKEMMNYL